MTTALALTLQLLLLLAAPAVAGQETNQLPDPDVEPADMRKPVQVYILMGQSNMLGVGKIKGEDGSLEHAMKEKGLYPYLVDDEGAWTVRQIVRNVRVMGSGTGVTRHFNNEFMTVTCGKIRAKPEKACLFAPQDGAPELRALHPLGLLRSRCCLFHSSGLLRGSR
jgi:hypothetical protein